MNSKFLLNQGRSCLHTQNVGVAYIIYGSSFKGEQRFFQKPSKFYHWSTSLKPKHGEGKREVVGHFLTRACLQIHHFARTHTSVMLVVSHGYINRKTFLVQSINSHKGCHPPSCIFKHLQNFLKEKNVHNKATFKSTTISSRESNELGITLVSRICSAIFPLEDVSVM